MFFEKIVEVPETVVYSLKTNTSPFEYRPFAQGWKKSAECLSLPPCVRGKPVASFRKDSDILRPGTSKPMQK